MEMELVECVHAKITQSHRTDTFSLHIIQIQPCQTRTQTLSVTSVTKPFSRKCVLNHQHAHISVNTCKHTSHPSPLSLFDLCEAAIYLLLEWTYTHNKQQLHFQKSITVWLKGGSQQRWTTTGSLNSIICEEVFNSNKHVCFFRTIYKDKKHESSPKVRSEHLDQPLVLGLTTGQKPLSLHYSWPDLGQKRIK